MEKNICENYHPIFSEFEPTDLLLDTSSYSENENDSLPMDIYLSRRFAVPTLAVYSWDLKNCLENKPTEKNWEIAAIAHHYAQPGIDYVTIRRDGTYTFLLALHFARTIASHNQEDQHLGLCAQLIRAERLYVKKAHEDFERTELKSSAILSQLATLPGLGIDIEQAPGKGSLAVLSIQYSRLGELVEHVHTLCGSLFAEDNLEQDAEPKKYGPPRIVGSSMDC